MGRKAILELFLGMEIIHNNFQLGRIFFCQIQLSKYSKNSRALEGRFYINTEDIQFRPDAGNLREIIEAHNSERENEVIKRCWLRVF